MRLIGQCPAIETLTMPLRNMEDDDDDDGPAYTAITCLSMSKLVVTSVPVIDALTLPHLREVFLNPQLGTTQHNALYALKQLLIRSNRLSALTSLTLIDVPLAAPAENSLLSILSQTHNLA